MKERPINKNTHIYVIVQIHQGICEAACNWDIKKVRSGVFPNKAEPCQKKSFDAIFYLFATTDEQTLHKSL